MRKNRILYQFCAISCVMGSGVVERQDHSMWLLFFFGRWGIGFNPKMPLFFS